MNVYKVSTINSYNGNIKNNNKAVVTWWKI